MSNVSYKGINIVIGWRVINFFDVLIGICVWVFLFY